MFKSFMHVGISVSDMQRSVAFYRDVLGFTVVGAGEAFDEEDTPLDLEGVHLLSTAMKCGDCQIELLQFLSPPGKQRAPKMNDAGCVHMALAVDDIQAVYQRLVQAGAEVNAPPQKDESGFEWAYWMFFKDPDGTMIEVVQSSGK
jgi:catechol 2,3-dioxygenase-like lactoylglutathione lyase family enzyme